VFLAVVVMFELSVGFEVLTAATVIRVVAPCSLVAVYRRFGGASLLQLGDVVCCYGYVVGRDLCEMEI
jgi:hypothetical protein